MTPKRCLVTGADGFIGRALCQRLIAEGYAVYGLDISPTLPEGVMRIGWSTEGSWELHKPVDVVYHCASLVGPVGVLHEHGSIGWHMLKGMRNILFRCRPARIVFTSTSEVYGNHDGQPVTENAQMRFEQEPSARREYAIGKLVCESMLMGDYSDYVIVRLFNCAGGHQDGEKGFVLPRWVEQARTGKPLTLYLPGTQRRTFTHVEDVVDALIMLADAPLAQDERLFNLGNPDNETSLHHLAQIVLRMTGSRAGVERVDPTCLWGEGFREAPDKLPSPSKLNSLGWEPRRDLYRIVKDAIEEYDREHRPAEGNEQSSEAAA